MTMGTFDENLLRMMHFLCSQKHYMNPKQISKGFKLSDKTVAEKTVRLWFKFLHGHRFDYFLKPYYESLGLSPVFVVCNLNEDMLKIFPQRTSIVVGNDAHRLEPVMKFLYVLPPHSLHDFRSLWEKAKSLGLVDYFEIFPIKTPFTFYSPFHKLLNKSGKINFPEKAENEIDNTYFMKNFKFYLTKELKPKIHELVEADPLTIPIIMEHVREHHSSKGMWFAMKKSLGDNIWDYVQRRGVSNKKGDGVGIRLVQQTLRDLHNNFESFFVQPAVVYYPFYHGESVIFYLFVKLKNYKDLPELANKISECSLSTTVYPPTKGSVVGFHVITNRQQSHKIIGEIIQHYIDKTWKSKIIFEDFLKCQKYWSKNSVYWKKYYMKSAYPQLFNPKTIEWKFDKSGYETMLERIAK